MADPPPHLPGIPGTWSPGHQPLAGAAPAFAPPALPGSGGPEAPRPIPNQALVLAGWGPRWVATLLDGLVRILIALFVVGAVFSVLVEDPFSTDIRSPDDVSHLAWYVIASALIYPIVGFVYAAPFMVRWNGATPGKRMLGLRVVNADGTNLSLGQALLREGVFKTAVVTIIGGSFFFPWVLNYLWPLWDPESRAGHDYMARSRVVRA